MRTAVNPTLEITHRVRYDPRQVHRLQVHRLNDKGASN